ncbi:RTA-like protein [Purpureocillium lavendulum]|uniref:RTA-like protein n=1 Tax=Purpureocillium lavendulum TaxID=1247861 RepID=A0AB34FHU1_9HYPO|nr:RTA-like protein [Purpureocillium lavendulum]
MSSLQRNPSVGLTVDPAISTPRAEYEADVAELQASLQELWTRAYATTDLRERAGIQNAVGVCHVDLHLLESRYKSNLEIETRKYEERTEAVIQELCDQLVAELGPSHIRGTLRALDPEELSCYVPKVTSDKIITRNERGYYHQVPTPPWD